MVSHSLMVKDTFDFIYVVVKLLFDGASVLDKSASNTKCQVVINPLTARYNTLLLAVSGLNVTRACALFWPLSQSMLLLYSNTVWMVSQNLATTRSCDSGILFFDNLNWHVSIRIYCERSRTTFIVSSQNPIMIQRSYVMTRAGEKLGEKLGPRFVQDAL